MNDRPWSETVPDGALGLRIGFVKEPVGPRRPRRLLIAAVAALGALFGIARAAWRGDLPLWMATLVLAGVCGAVNPVWSLVDGFMIDPAPIDLSSTRRSVICLISVEIVRVASAISDLE